MNLYGHLEQRRLLEMQPNRSSAVRQDLEHAEKVLEGGRVSTGSGFYVRSPCKSMCNGREWYSGEPDEPSGDRLAMTRCIRRLEKHGRLILQVDDLGVLADAE